MYLNSANVTVVPVKWCASPHRSYITHDWETSDRRPLGTISGIDVTGAPWPVLPAGVHKADLGEIAAAFAINQWRRRLFDGLLEASRVLKAAGCARLYLDGSYVTGKPIPGDYDVCWDPVGVVGRLLPRVFRDFSNDRAAQKAAYGGEFSRRPQRRIRWERHSLSSFNLSDTAETRKGILEVELTTDPMI